MPLHRRSYRSLCTRRLCKLLYLKDLQRFLRRISRDGLTMAFLDVLAWDRASCGFSLWHRCSLSLDSNKWCRAYSVTGGTFLRPFLWRADWWYWSVMKRRNWQADMNPMAGRIDTRSQSDPAVAAGMRGIHRDTGGNVIGGYTAEGSPLGTKKSVAAVGGSATPRLDAGVQTPRLDSNPRQPMIYGNSADRRAQDVSAARSVAADGGFGIGAQQREQQRAGRQSLFERMKTAGAGGVTPAMAKEAASLGVTRGGWRNALGKIPQPPASIAAVNAPPSVQTGVPPILASVGAQAPAAVAPLAGADKARADMAKYGVMGAAKRSLETSATAKTQKARQQWRSASAVPSSKPMTPLGPKPSPQSIGLPQTKTPPAISFAVPPVANVQAVASPQTSNLKVPAASPVANRADSNPVTFTPAARGRTPEDAKAWAKELIAKDVAKEEARRSKVATANAASDKQPMPYGVAENSLAAPVVRGFRRWRNGMGY